MEIHVCQIHVHIMSHIYMYYFGIAHSVDGVATTGIPWLAYLPLKVVEWHFACQELTANGLLSTCHRNGLMSHTKYLCTPGTQLMRPCVTDVPHTNAK